MFDIGFWELAVIGVVALLVVGPERLPGLARTAGIWVRKIRRFVSSVREDIEQEIRADELKQLMGKGGQHQDIPGILKETKDMLHETSRELSADVAQPPGADANNSGPPQEVSRGILDSDTRPASSSGGRPAHNGPAAAQANSPHGEPPAGS